MWKLAEIFSDHMTLQCGKPVRIMGESDAAGEITVRIDGEAVLTTQVEEGPFTFELPPHPAAESTEIRLERSAGEESAGTVITLTDVDFGEVFLAGGQSNMEFLLRYDQDYRNGEPVEKDEHLRFYDVGEYAFEGEKEEGFKSGAFWDRWYSADPARRDELDHFSAVGFYFARHLRKAYGRPVAIVGCNWGGTTASTWVPKKALTGRLSVYQQEYDAAVSTYPPEEYLLYEKMARQGSESPQGLAASDAIMYGNDEWEAYCQQMAAAPLPEGYDAEQMQVLQTKIMKYMDAAGPHNKNRPGALYETMLLKIAGFSVRGVLWYQGESDENHAELYGELFTLLIHEWRALWKEELPFLFVQLAPFESWLACLGTNYPEVRAQQQSVEETVSQVYMVSISDIGNRLDIHPKRKKPVGERLALKARHYLFGEDIACDYPEPVSATLYDGAVLLQFEGCEELVIREASEGETGTGGSRHLAELFEVTADGVPVPVSEVRAEGRSLFLTCSAVSESTEDLEVRFAQRPYYEVNLFNEAGIPAAPFVI